MFNKNCINEPSDVERNINLEKYGIRMISLNNYKINLKFNITGNNMVDGNLIFETNKEKYEQLITGKVIYNEDEFNFNGKINLYFYNRYYSNPSDTESYFELSDAEHIENIFNYLGKATNITDTSFNINKDIVSDMLNSNFIKYILGVNVYEKVKVIKDVVFYYVVDDNYPFINSMKGSIEVGNDQIINFSYIISIGDSDNNESN